ncbi:LysR family transcriptional regulator [Salipiger mucosus]|uniref:Transcriptional regulator, LysR family n=1 Tax=Salipiger mucosus DSM 16094 TaxID=1123237 RepID=S9S9F5_9RHOB|nr:LysR family transcriptional regulator [Salipiger mucosus]EPX86795.1 transcriptional regulator, LysR family [Salipiger mucosus DSM 16094]
MSFDLQSLELFRSIAETGSIAGAAARHGIAPSAVSKRLASLEAEAATELVIRHRRGIELTPAGRLVLKHAETLANQLAGLQSELRDQRSGGRGVIRMAANTSAITQFLPEDLAEFVLSNPGTTIRMAELESIEIIEAVTVGPGRPWGSFRA